MTPNNKTTTPIKSRVPCDIHERGERNESRKRTHLIFRHNDLILALQDNCGSLVLPHISSDTSDFYRAGIVFTALLRRQLGIAGAHFVRYVSAAETELPGCCANDSFVMVDTEMSDTELTRAIPQSRWVSKTDISGDPGFHCRVAEIVEESFASENNDDMAWRKLRWVSKVTEWARSILDTQNISLCNSVTLNYNTHLSAVLQLEVEYRKEARIPIGWNTPTLLFLKSVPSNSREVQNTISIARVLPNIVPPILASCIDEKQCVMLQVCGNFFPDGNVEEPEIQHIVFDTLFEMQMETAEKIGELLEEGIPHRGLDWLSREFAICACSTHVGVHDSSGILESEIVNVQQMCATLAELGLPETLVHGDFVNVNVLAGENSRKRAGFIDWERCHIGFPLMDCANWEIGWGPFGEGFYEAEIVKERYLRKWIKYTSWESVKEASEMCKTLLRCMGLCRAVEWRSSVPAVLAKYFDEVVNFHVQSVMNELRFKSEASSTFHVASS